MNSYPYKYPDVLERFMKEQFCFDSLLEAGLFTEEYRGDYQKQADRICHFFGYENVFEYGAQSINCHLSLGDGKSFTGIIKGIYDE